MPQGYLLLDNIYSGTVCVFAYIFWVVFPKYKGFAGSGFVFVCGYCYRYGSFSYM